MGLAQMFKRKSLWRLNCHKCLARQGASNKPISNSLDGVCHGQGRNDSGDALLQGVAHIANQSRRHKWTRRIVNENMPCASRQYAQPVPYGILPQLAPGRREPRQSQVISGMKLAQALFMRVMVGFGKNKNNAGNRGTAAHGSCCVPVQGHATPRDKLLGAAACGSSKTAALSGSQQNGPGLVLPWGGDGRFRHG